MRKLISLTLCIIMILCASVMLSSCDVVTDKLEAIGDKVPVLGGILDKILPDDETPDVPDEPDEPGEPDEPAEPVTYTVTVTVGENGTVSPAGEVTVEEGASQTFTITANTGYKVADVKVNGVSVGAVATYTVENVTANVTIEATFEALPPEHVCAPVIVNKVEATCTAEGKEAYYLCTCGKAYEDAEATAEIADITTYGVIAKLAHDYADATCTDPKTCKNCPATEGEANGHAPKTEWTTDEENHWHECENCDEALDEEAHVDANLDSKCDVCGEKTGTDHTLPPQPFN